jgi:hypothetical protein
MAKEIVMEEFHLTIYAPSTLAEAAYAAIRRALDRSGFRAELGRAARAVLQRHPPLRQARVTLSR